MPWQWTTSTGSLARMRAIAARTSAQARRRTSSSKGPARRESERDRPPPRSLPWQGPASDGPRRRAPGRCGRAPARRLPRRRAPPARADRRPGGSPKVSWPEERPFRVPGARGPAGRVERRPDLGIEEASPLGGSEKSRSGASRTRSTVGSKSARIAACERWASNIARFPSTTSAGNGRAGPSGDRRSAGRPSSRPDRGGRTASPPRPGPAVRASGRPSRRRRRQRHGPDGHLAGVREDEADVPAPE